MIKNIILIFVLCTSICNAWTQCGLQGSILDEQGQAVMGAEINLTHLDNVLSTANSDSQGNFVLSLGDIDQAGVSLMVNQESNNVLDGVSTLDMVIIIKHILLEEVLGTSNLEAIADINCDGNISMIDVVYMRRVILGLDQHFPNGDYCGLSDQGLDLNNLTIANCTVLGVGDNITIIAYPKGNVSGN